MSAKMHSRRRFLAGAATTGWVLLGCGKDEAAQPAVGGTKTAALPDDGSPDLAVWGGTILTMAPFSPRVEAVAIRDGMIVSAGDRANIEKLIGTRTQVVDLAGGLATPGLTDAHGHLSSLGRDLEEVDLRGADSIDEVTRRLRDHKHPRQWVEGRGWDQNLWPNAQMPSHEPLTQLFPKRPVWLRRVDGHAGWGNAALLAAAGITAETEEPEGGEILRDEEGNPTGVLVDAAMELVPTPTPSQDDYRRWILAGQHHAVARGLTGVHDMGIGPDEHAVYQSLSSAQADGLRLRVHGYANQDWFAKELVKGAKPEAPQPEDLYALAGVKYYADGALGSRGAAMLASYSDRPRHRGLLRYKQRVLDRMCLEAMRSGWQVATHAIGDGGNRATLRAYDKALQRHGDKNHRFRIEHCQILHPSDIPMFARLGVIASMQPTHATSDMAWVPDRIGQRRLAGAYVWRKLLSGGARLCFGSDFPVELADVTHGLYAAVTRQNAAGKPDGGWLPDQRLTLEEALRAFSAEAAFAAKRDEHLGMIREGFQADLTCFSENLLEVPPQQLRDAKILATIVRGKVEHGG